MSDITFVKREGIYSMSTASLNANNIRTSVSVWPTPLHYFGIFYFSTLYSRVSACIEFPCARSNVTQANVAKAARQREVS